MPKSRTTFSKEEIQRVLEWQRQTVEIAVAQGMTTPILAQLQKNMLWDIARQFDIALADSPAVNTKHSGGIEGRPALDPRLGAQKETTPSTLG